jgi:hypothetical protein
MVSRPTKLIFRRVLRISFLFVTFGVLLFIDEIYVFRNRMLFCNKFVILPPHWVLWPSPERDQAGNVLLFDFRTNVMLLLVTGNGDYSGPIFPRIAVLSDGYIVYVPAEDPTKPDIRFHVSYNEIFVADKRSDALNVFRLEPGEVESVWRGVQQQAGEPKDFFNLMRGIITNWRAVQVAQTQPT